MPSFSINGQIIYQPEKKAEALMTAFFPPPVRADLNDIDENAYPTPYNMGKVVRNEIVRIVFRASPRKVSGIDKIPNLVLQKTISYTLPVLEKLINGCLEAGYYPKHFRDSITVTLRKPGKGDYITPKV